MHIILSTISKKQRNGLSVKIKAFLPGITLGIAVVMMITCAELNQLKDKSIIDEILMDIM